MTGPRARRLLAGSLTLLALVAAAPAPATPAPGPASTAVPGGPGGPGKIDDGVLRQLAAGGPADVMVLLSEEADLAAAARQPDRTARGRQVVDALRQTADRSQAGVRHLLREKGLGYQSFWVSNAMLVQRASRQVVERLATRPEVRQIRAPRVYANPGPVAHRPAGAAPNGVEWGLANINADDVWAQTGVRGDGIVVANIDSGVEFDHPALVRSYRGNNGDGTFTHDYNWFDVSGSCTGAPCESAANSHGTHTMGTMVGDDGAGNQTGVAPGARWIAVNGCATCTEANLLAAAQWVLAPTDRAGQNPDVSRRPHIVNNSWGSVAPSDEPLMEDVLQAWAAAGIFGAWANGNSGAACRTSGSPGSRILNYSVGAYGVNNQIAGFSSRGPGQDGETKPNISAPGDGIRSTASGGGYAVLSGTSMATPHVSGAVALLWSAHPELARNIEDTRLLLDLTAVDTDDTRCGGTAQDNNVYGEGRLDALALVRAGATGVGTLGGTVTDASTGGPVTAATVTITGPMTRQVPTGADGRYSQRLLSGDYAVRVEAFGYLPATGTVRVAKGEPATLDLAVTPTTRVPVSGIVRDGSGHGWPLYAAVSATDDQGRAWTTHTDPATGAYRLDLLPDTAYTLRVAVVYPGYPAVSRRVTVGLDARTEDVVVTVALTCAAPGYQASYTGPVERFAGGRPAGWSVVDVDHRFPGYDHRPGWVFGDPAGRGNTTGGSDAFAIVDSDHYGQHHVQDTSLISPALDLSSHRAPVLEFATELQPAVNATATVDLSTDGGRTWTTIWRRSGFPGVPGPGREVVSLPEPAGRATLRFHYTGQWSGWWKVDDVFVGDKSCRPVPGGLLVGQVTDGATGAGVPGATVTSVADPGERAATVATPDDPNLGDGFYWLATARTGEQRFTAATEAFPPRTETAAVGPDAVTVLNFVLGAAG